MAGSPGNTRIKMNVKITTPSNAGSEETNRLPVRRATFNAVTVNASFQYDLLVRQGSQATCHE
jgi:hypothetical protein